MSLNLKVLSAAHFTRYPDFSSWYVHYIRAKFSLRTMNFQISIGILVQNEPDYIQGIKHGESDKGANACFGGGNFIMIAV